MTSTILVTHILLSLVVSQIDVAQSTLAVAVRDSPDAGVAQIELTNLGPVPIVAWALKIVGSDGRTSYTTQDNYIHLATQPVGPRVLMQGTPTLVATREARRLRGATITPIAVVYADRTAIGDPERLTKIFADRRAEADAWDELMPQLEALSRSNLEASLMRTAATEILDPTATKGGRAWRTSISESLVNISTSAQRAEEMRALMADLRRYADAARLHASRP
jgi:hypothetical protein